MQKLKEFLEGRNLITKLEAKHDLIEKTMGESKCRPHSILYLSWENLCCLCVQL